MSLLDKVINYVSPAKGLARAQAQAAQEVLRNYDIASRGRRNDGWLRPNTDGAAEVSKGNQIGAASAQELVRNNPLAGRIKRIWANNAIGSGIQLDILGDSSDQFQLDWDEWAESTDCDFEGHYNLYGLQWLWTSTMVESGGVFVVQRINATLKHPLQLQTLEESQLDKGKNVDDVRDGVAYDKQGRLKGYWFITDDSNSLTPQSKFFKASQVFHMFRKDRVGQHLGMTWLAPVATLLRNYDTYMDAKLMQQQIAACFALIVEDANTNMGNLGNSSDGSNLLPDSIESAMIEYVPSGTIPHTITPPKADNSAQFDLSIKSDIAVGSSVTREQLTGDYSQVNFTSGRMAKNEFNIELDFVQKSLIKPNLEKVFRWFSVLHQIKNGAGSYSTDWTFPPRSTINPKEEFDVLMSKVRHGMMSPSKAAKLFGEKLETIVAQWGKDKALFGDLPFDIDPSVFAATGNQLDDNDAASANNTVTKDNK